MELPLAYINEMKALLGAEYEDYLASFEEVRLYGLRANTLKISPAELAEKGVLTSSCCPAFVDYIHKKFPQMVEHISHNLSPMGAIGQFIKGIDPTAKIVFIGPCTAKKMEFQKESNEVVKLHNLFLRRSLRKHWECKFVLTQYRAKERYS